MTRPKCCRKITSVPDILHFSPSGKTPSEEEVVLTLDEFEAIRLADYDALYQEQAAARMNISRQTFGRILDAAHKKIADVLIHGKTLKIDGGKVSIGADMPRCEKCVRGTPDANEKKCTMCCKTKIQGERNDENSNSVRRQQSR
ncbi:MAG TPA: DUF134 domain-containing protein [Spirochaetota bacterium]